MAALLASGREPDSVSGSDSGLWPPRRLSPGQRTKQQQNSRHYVSFSTVELPHYRLTRPYRGKIELLESDLCGGKGEGRVPDQKPRRQGNGGHETSDPAKANLTAKKTPSPKPANLLAPS